MPIDDPRFGKLFRCPNNPLEADVEHQERLRKISNLNAFAEKTFDNFAISSDTLKSSEINSLENARNSAQEFAENPDGWLLLKGRYGTGKTHLAAAIGNMQLQQGHTVLFITVPDLLDHLRSTFGPSSETAYDVLFDRIRNVFLLILDDLGAENSSEWAQEKLFQIFDHRYSRHLPTVITTNANLDKLDSRIHSRLLDSQLTRLIQINTSDYRNSLKIQGDELSSNLAVNYGDMTFETFDTRKGLNSEQRTNLEYALKIAQDYAESPRGNALVIMGEYFTGKTHLAAAIAHQRDKLGDDVMFVTIPDLLDHLRVAFSPDARVSFDERFQKVKTSTFLVLDNLGTENATPWASEKLFQIIDYRYLTRRPTVITTAKSLDDIDKRIRSRLFDIRRCMIFELRVPDYPSRLVRK